MTDIEITGELGVHYVDHMGSDLSIIRAMLVDVGHKWDEEADTKRIAALIRDKHTSPFEHTAVTLAFEVPIFVARQLMRHRTASYNEYSGRYRNMQPKFYSGPFRGRVKGTKKMDMVMERLKFDTATMTLLTGLVEISYGTAWDIYQELLFHGVAEEQAREVLPLSIYTQYLATNDLHNWMKFLALRMDSHAQAEARAVADLVYLELQKLFPAAIAAWDKAGRPNF